MPAAVFISVVMGGGYGTGREVVEFFTRYGLLGLLGIGVAACVFALVLACTYEFARVFQVYDYRTFSASSSVLSGFASRYSTCCCSCWCWGGRFSRG